jgi:4-amino-4-deoxy-L-arabinose transferase-like glycosyltransferase
MLLLIHTIIAKSDIKLQHTSPHEYKHRSLNILLWAFVVAGIILRVFHFIHNRSLWNDEAYLANSLIRMDFTELMQGPLAYHQKAPITYLWISRLSVLLFGKTEMALRLFSFLCGIASLFVFLPVARYFLKPLGAVVAMAILAMAGSLVFHAVEAKQYSVELLSTIVALYLYIKYHNRLDFSSLLLWGLWGAILVWFSYPVIFVLAGIAFAMCLSYLIKKEWNSLLRSVLPFSLWLVSFAVNYFLFTYKHHENSEWLLRWFADHGAFMPLPPASVSDLAWFFHTAYMTLRFSVGLLWIYFTHENPLIQLVLRMPMLPLLLAFIGVIALYRNNKQVLMLLTFPILFALLASGLKLFPFFERLTVFLAPLLILLIVYGCQKAMDFLHTDSKWKYAIPVLLLVGPVMNSTMQLVNTSLFGEHKQSKEREGLLFIKDKLQQGDQVYMFWNNLHFYEYYKEAYDLNYEAIIGGDEKFVSSDIQDYQTKLDQQISVFAGQKRIWVMYNKFHKYNLGEMEHQIPWYDKEEVKPGYILHEKFSALGKELASYDTGEFRVSLFDLSTK